MSLSFPFYQQRDAMDCGPTCLMMIAAAHGRKYTLPFLRERSYLSREGVSAQGIMEAAESIGFRTMTVKVPFDRKQYRLFTYCPFAVHCALESESFRSRI
jgi:ATP-binding cassette, subfamily B, bacterial